PEKQSLQGVIFILPLRVNQILPDGVNAACPRGSNARGFSIRAILLHSAVCGENLATMSAFSGLWHTCDIYGFNIFSVVPLRK
ncbi:MAG: hypothetical protein J6V92_10095, partial [Bacteroidaceae bacterium]|nr:hypothetical protein [Bacteroidaceae bacterium]